MKAHNLLLGFWNVCATVQCVCGAVVFSVPMVHPWDDRQYVLSSGGVERQSWTHERLHTKWWSVRWLVPRNRVLDTHVTLGRRFNKFLDFYRVQMFIAVFAKASECSQSYTCGSSVCHLILFLTMQVFWDVTLYPWVSFGVSWCI
jgi:hypothetical protein